MRIGIVTVLFGSASVIDGFVKSLNLQNWKDFEVFIIANDKDITCKNIIDEKANFKNVFIQNDENLGVARANNQGLEYFAKQVDVDYITFLNNDVEFDNDFLQKHIEIFDKNPTVECLTPKCLYFSDNEIWYAGGKLSYLKSGVRHFGHRKNDIFGHTGLHKVSYAPTCSLTIKLKVLLSKNIKMLELLFVYFDDYEFCIDLKRNKIPIYYSPEIILKHKVSNSTGGTKSDFSRYYLTRNKYYLMRKHFSIMFALFPLMMVIRLFANHKIEVKAMMDSLKMRDK